MVATVNSVDNRTLAADFDPAFVEAVRRALAAVPSRDAIESLSTREREVYERIGGGLSVKEIASDLLLSPKTIEYHRQHIKEKLGAKSSAQLARMATTYYVLAGAACATTVNA